MLTKPAKANNRYDYSGEKYKSPAGILLHSRTAVETDHFVSTGVLSYAEGDVLEIELPEYKRFNLGDSAKITVYSPGGIYTFQSKVVAKGEGALIFINPPHNRNRFVDKREHPRVEVNETGVLRMPANGAKDEESFMIQNISMSGLGFTFPQELAQQTCHIEVKLGQGFTFDCQVDIIRKESFGDKFYYGARFKELGTELFNPLRAYIVKRQVELHFQRKKAQSETRTFR